nr:DUF3182 family protein [Novosphingobium kaempferiae]
MNARPSILTLGDSHAGENLRNLHDAASRSVLAQRVASLSGGEVIERNGPPRAGSFLIPDDTLSIEDARAWGIESESQLLGGAVPFAFVATKIVSHGLPFENAICPQHWSAGLCVELDEAVLRGYSVFSHADARIAGRRLLERGPVRLKDVEATSGRGQEVVRNVETLDAALDRCDALVLERAGLVLEEDLEDVETYSVGVVRLFGRSIAYWGTQRLTRDNSGQEVYGGSHLRCVRGGWEELEALNLEPELAQVIGKARHYDAAVFAAYPGTIASRRNYDVAAGRDAQGLRKTGVLEQSWRVGGASGAEIAAFEAFDADSSLAHAQTATVEIYGEAAGAPNGATIYFSGIDPAVGPLTKYAEKR